MKKMIHTEVHITVLTSHAELFKLTCKKFGIKYTEISFLSDKENHLMTSIRKRFDKLKEIYDYLNHLYYVFRDVSILRSKVECNYSEEYKYIEAHLTILNKDIDLFNSLNLNWVISYNNTKLDTFSITRRVYPSDTEDSKDLLLNDFETLKNIVLEKHIELEYCILDTNPMLDLNWI